MQPVPQKRGKSDDRRQAIALATRALIVEKGLEGLRTRDIAQRVGINIATLHYHVPTKEALIALVAESIRTDFHDQALRQERAGKNALGLLRLEFADFLEVVESMPELIIVMTEMMERARRDPVVQQIMAPLHDFWRMQFVEIFQLGISDGWFRPDLDPMSAAFITTGALVDSWRQWTSFSAPVQPLQAELERCFIPQSTVLQG